MLQPTKFLLFTPSILVLQCQHLLPHLNRNLYHRYASDDEEANKFSNTRERESGQRHFQLYKSRGQHLLTNVRVLDSIVKSSNIKATDTVLEIGPGTGNLTLRLLEAAHTVVAVEIDRRMVETLHKRVSEHGHDDNLTIICKDALKTELPEFDLVVANIPYGISSPLIAKLVFGTSSFRSATLLLQKEFARRLLANPGDSEFNRLAVNVKLVAEVEHVMDVSKRDFFPVPKVDSSVVVIRPKSEIPNVDLYEWCAFTRTCFSKKNKTLGATFKQKKKLIELMRLSNLMELYQENLVVGHVSDASDKYNDAKDGGSIHSFTCAETDMALFKDKLIEILRSSGFENKRPSKISIEELLHLLFMFNQNRIFFHNKKDATNTELAASFDL